MSPFTPLGLHFFVCQMRGQTGWILNSLPVLIFYDPPNTFMLWETTLRCWVQFAWVSFLCAACSFLSIVQMEWVERLAGVQKHSFACQWISFSLSKWEKMEEALHVLVAKNQTKDGDQWNPSSSCSWLGVCPLPLLYLQSEPPLCHINYLFHYWDLKGMSQKKKLDGAIIQNSSSSFGVFLGKVAGNAQRNTEGR